MESQEAYDNDTSALALKPFTKLSIRLEQDQTKHKRPILFIVPARAGSLLTYSIHGKDRNLFKLKDELDGIRALYYKKPVEPEQHSVTHHVRIIGQSSRNPRHDVHQMKELNMKVKIIVVK